jgi:hypothetical protein
MCGCCRFAVGLDLRQEPLGADHRGQLGAEHLDGDLAIVLEVLGEVDGCHPALTELPLDPVAVTERRGEAIDQFRPVSAQGSGPDSTGTMPRSSQEFLR